MPAIVRSEFALALNQVATERGIDPTVVLETIKAAILAAYRKDYGADELEKLTVEVNPDTGEARIFKQDKNITPPGFGRIAAQTAKQVILQRIREAEKQAILTDYSAKVGSIVSGMVLRFDNLNIIVDIGRAQAVMSPQEQVANERYRLNQRLIFYIVGIRESYRGNEIVVSRAHKGLVTGLFQREVPEVSQGAVEIKDVAREPGHRSKVAVYSNQSGVDPVGSCVGQKGVRVQAVISELGGEEKIDIIQWNDDPIQFITQALSPATDLIVKLDQEKKTAQVSVPDDQLSLAIGRDGQNVRLAAKLTGWKIDLIGKGTQKTGVTIEADAKKVTSSKRQKSTVLYKTKKSTSEKTTDSGKNRKVSKTDVNQSLLTKEKQPTSSTTKSNTSAEVKKSGQLHKNEAAASLNHQNS